MDKLNAAIMEAYEGYQTALDYVKGWKQEAANRKSYCMALINAARKSNPELGAISAKDLFTRTAEMYEAAHAPAEATAGEDQEAPAEEEAADEVEQATTEDQQAEDQQDPEEETTAGEDQEAPTDA